MTAAAAPLLLTPTIDIGMGLSCDLDRLIATRLLVQANSGGGKTRTLRRLLEQSHGKVQHLVIDPEGEYHTLRERFDYVLAAPKGGDTVAHPRTAAVLAERLLQLGVSAILDIYELNPDDRLAFVKAFCEALVNAPRELWHPVLVVLDEAHIFCPENGKAESADAVKALASRGRKRGFCLVPATQRIAKFAKDVAAECNNKLIGRCAQDVDMKRAGEELGFSAKADVLSLRTLEAGQFYAFGPAFGTTEPRLVKVGPVVTSHPEAGQQAAPVPPPTAHVRAILDQLADLPAEAEEREKSIETLKRENATLRRQLTEAQKTGDRSPKPEVQRIEVPVLSEADRALLASIAVGVDTLRSGTVPVDIAVIVTEVQRAVNEIVDAGRRQVVAAIDGTAFSDILQRLRTVGPTPAAARPASVRTFGERFEAAAQTEPRATAAGDIGKPERDVLAVLATQPNGCESGRLCLLAGKRWSGGFRNILSRLRTGGLIDGGNTGVMTITAAGRALVGDVRMPAPGRELAEHWLAHQSLGGPEREVLKALLTHPKGLTADRLCAVTGKAWSGGFRNVLAKLRTAGVLVGKNGEIMRAHEDLLS